MAQIYKIALKTFQGLFSLWLKSYNINCNNQHLQLIL